MNADARALFRQIVNDREAVKSLCKVMAEILPNDDRLIMDLAEALSKAVTRQNVTLVASDLRK